MRAFPQSKKVSNVWQNFKFNLTSLRGFKMLALIIVIAITSCSFTTKKFENPDKDKLLIDLVTYVLGKGHYNPKTINDDFSKQVFESFIESIDPLKRYFYASDIKEFLKYKTKIDDQIINKDIAFFNLVYTRLMKRIEESQKLSLSLLDTPFDYSKIENLNVDYESRIYMKSKKDMKNRWRKQLKYSTISFYNDKLEIGKVIDNSNDKVNDTVVIEVITKNEEPLSKKEAEIEARKKTKEMLVEFYDISNEIERKDWFTNYINAIVEVFDPHTFYFAPRDKEDFDQKMSGKLEGIGARLQKKNDEIKIVELISGGPAWRGQTLEVGDVISAVRQSDELEATSILGVRIGDAVKLIKGPKGTKVFLTIKKVDGSVNEITIERDVVELEETYAKSAILNKNNRNFGLINLPKFYVDFSDYKKGRNAASDVKKEIIRLKKQGMEGLVIDLRSNGGGSLQTVVEMAGLFIKEGPIVQVKGSDESKEVLEDTDNSILWDGPLVILVNELSASASEILAAALQDYKRAIIIGGKQTYGKGTVQNVYDLNNLMRNSDFGDVGALKVTTQKFYRINGGSTQLEGVKSDVVVVDRYSFIDIGEKEQDNPLPWDKITPATYTAWDGFINYEETIKNSTDRMQNSPQLKLIEEQARWYKTQTDDNEVSLNYSDYLAELDNIKEVSKKFEALRDYKNTLAVSSLPYEKQLILKDSVLGEKRSAWHGYLTEDVYVDEAVNVLEDLQLNNIKVKRKVALKK